jgi:hypothetical protein
MDDLPAARGVEDRNGEFTAMAPFETDQPGTRWPIIFGGSRQAGG